MALRPEIGHVWHCAATYSHSTSVKTGIDPTAAEIKFLNLQPPGWNKNAAKTESKDGKNTLVSKKKVLFTFCRKENLIKVFKSKKNRI